jgi:sialate O-acetylesterase
LPVRNLTWSFAVLLSAFLAGRADAAVKPHGLFTDGMVLQQGTKVPLWGTADNDEKVTVRCQGQEASAIAKDGKWMVHLKDLKAGGPFELTIQGTNTITLKDVLVGEVWVCSGQSNMEWSVRRSKDPEETAQKANHPMIRLFQVPKTPAATPRTQLGQGKTTPTWQHCTPESVIDFSAVGYAFGRYLHQARKVPVGLIQAAWGGTESERWTRTEVLQELAEKGIALGKQKSNSDLYNGMIAPLMPFAIQGVIWYQGESNASRAQAYRTAFPAMIKNWRDDWKQGDFPFLFVQLAPWDGPKEPTWPELREAQLVTALRMKSVAMAVITDLGDPKDIHPKDKDPVGERLALCARAVAYKEETPFSGPVYQEMKVEGNKAVVSFKNTGGGLMAKGGKLTGFTIAGADKRFVDAEATIVGDTVIVTSAQLERPVAVRFGWANYPVVNLYDRSGLPASPFRTDDFPGITK